MISLIVPVRGEGPPDPEVVRHAAGAEILVAAAAETDEAALAPWRLAGARVLSSSAPRGARLRAAAAEAAGDVLLFLHSDTLLPEGWAFLVERAIRSGASSGAFRLAFAGAGPALRLVAFFANLRTALTRVPWGDQAPFARRDVYERAGGHPAWPLLDDRELGRRLRRAGRVALLPERVLTSPRRYEARGVARTVLANWAILVRHRLGASPEELARRYRSG